MAETVNRQLILVARPKGDVGPECFELRRGEIPVPQPGEALALEDIGLAVERQMIAELRDHGPGDELFGRQAAGHDMFRRMGLRHAPREQRRQAYLGRGVTSTRNCAGMTSRRSDTSSPIFTISPQPQGQSVLSGSITRSMRGRCGGR